MTGRYRAGPRTRPGIALAPMTPGSTASFAMDPVGVGGSCKVRRRQWLRATFTVLLIVASEE